ncbi:MAG: hypothetical protein ACT6S0_16905 [Roseateles sp.]|uniref:hypothetical protein n=1 Tax=Roseateles sp. TaxID=1971397 RepID=UPI0040375504
MRAKSKLLALALTAALQPALAGVVSLDFEHETDVSKVAGFYAAQGVVFSGNAWSISSNQNGCPGIALFSRTNSCGGLLLGVDPLQSPGAGSTSFMIDLAGGFVTEFSFVYGIRSSANVTIKVFDELDGKGNLLQSLNGLSGSACDVGVLSFCEWYSTSIRFSGVAKSVMVTGVDQRLMMDDLQFITPTTVPGQLPEPASMALALSALGALAWARKRAAR